MARKRPLPKFRYHPDPLGTGSIIRKDAVCQVCGQPTPYVYDVSFHWGGDDDPILCPWCIYTGEAAEALDGVFLHESSCQPVDDSAKLEELCLRTPSYEATQQAVWLTCCGDACVYRGEKTWPQLEAMGIAPQLEAAYRENPSSLPLSMDAMRYSFYGGAQVQHYLFQCRHCKQYHLHTDWD